jgi:uncharacterized repeat protein (TIGR03803 family)
LTIDKSGNLYGSSIVPFAGAVFKLDTGGNESVLYTFSDGADGGFPNSALMIDATGTLYGTTSDGGNDCHGLGCGVIFSLDQTGTETVLYSFEGNSGGYAPYAGLVRDSSGNFYGTAQFAGFDNGFGTVFEFTP